MASGSRNTRTPNKTPKKKPGVLAWLRRRDGVLQKYRFASASAAASHPQRPSQREIRRHNRAIKSQGRDKFNTRSPVRSPPAPVRQVPPGPAPAPGRAAASRPSEPRPFRESKAGNYTTWFKATGSIGSISPALQYNAPLFDDDLDDFAAPAAFFTNQADVLGRVVWDGIVPLRELLAEVNIQLQYFGEGRADFDFRIAYDTWSYKYQVVEDLGGKKTVVQEVRDGQ